MTQTYPSRRTVVVDVPEVGDFKAKFVYNFFSVDEDLNDLGTTPPDFIEKRAANNFDEEFIASQNFNRFTPRYTQFSWKANAAGNRPELARTISIQNNIQKIHNEDTFTDSNFTNLYFADSGQDQKLAFFVRRAFDEAIKTQNAEDPNSPLDIAWYLNANTSSKLTTNFFAEVLTNYSNAGINFLETNDKEKLTSGILKKLSRSKVRAQINNKFLFDALLTTKQNTINVFDDEEYIVQAKQVQDRNREEKPSSIFDAADYDFEILDIIDYRTIDLQTNSFDASVQVVGYIIDKVEYGPNGPIRKEPIVIEDPFSSTTVDLKIKYGSKYGYRIRSIAYIEMLVEDMDPNNSDYVAVSFLVSSKQSKELVVDTIEAIAPPPPADFNVTWDYFKSVPVVTWTFPVNPQRDIKHFQIFRRTDINQPFELIRQYSFNDSQTPRPTLEEPDPSLIEQKLGNITTSFSDLEFKKNESVFIYAVCTVDAHGLTSNYSTQLEVRFDKFKNSIIKKLISVQGAPKAYPNMYLQQDTFIDAIKTSGKHNLSVYFNPEYLKAVDRNGNDLRLLKTDDTDAFYRISMINVDLQESQNVDIKILDKRTSRDKESS